MSYPRVHINEECMREGMQIESVDISIEDKVRLLDALSETGLTSIVVGSFVSPKYTPQMAEIDELMTRFTPQPGVTYSALALNEKGRERAAEFTPPLAKPSGPPMLWCHLCDTFTRRNANVSQEQEIERWPQIVERARERGVREAEIGVNAAFGSNFEGAFTLEQRMEKLRRAHSLWDEAAIPVTRVTIGDPDELVHAASRRGAARGDPRGVARDHLLPPPPPRRPWHGAPEHLRGSPRPRRRL